MTPILRQQQNIIALYPTQQNVSDMNSIEKQYSHKSDAIQQQQQLLQQQSLFVLCGVLVSTWYDGSDGINL